MGKQDKFTKSARGKPCQIRIPGVCRPAPDNETTVLCHLNGGGMATKNLSIHGAYGCSSCHDVIDGRVQTQLGSTNIKLWHHEGVIRTQSIMVKEGVLKL